MVERIQIAIRKPHILQLALLVFLATFIAAEFSLWVNARASFFPGQEHVLHGLLTSLVVAVVLIAGYSPLASHLIRREKKQISAVLSRFHQSPDRAQLLAELHEGYFCLDADWCVLYVNPAAYSLLGLPPGTLEGHKIWELLPGFRETEFYAQYCQLYASGGKREFEAYDPHFRSWFRVYAVCRQDILEVYFNNIDAEHKVRRQLSESVLREQLMFESNPQPMLIFGLESLEILDANNAALEFYGYTRPAMVKLTALDLRPAEDIPQFLKLLATFKNGQFIRGQSRHRRQDGSWLWVAVTGLIIRYQNSRACLSVIQDISGQVSAEESRRHSEQRLRAIFERTTLGLAEINQDGDWLKVNPALCEFLQYGEADLLNRNEHAFSLGGHDAREQEFIAQINRGERDHYALTKQYRRQDGSTRWAEVQRVAIRDHLSGQLRYFIVIIKDVDEQYRAQQVLADAERHFRQVADSAPMMLWQVDAQGEPLYFNRAWREFLYLDGQQPRHARWTDQLHPEERLLCEQMFHAALQNRQEFRLDFRLKRHDGRYRWVTQVARPLLDGQTFTGFIATATDITDRKLQEQQVKASEMRLRGITAGVPGLVFEMTHHRQCGEWRFHYLSDGAQTLLQLPPADLLRDFSLFLRCFNPMDIDEVLRELKQAAIQGLLSTQHELRLITPSQPWIELRVAISSDRRLDIFHGILLDVTEKKMIERERASTAARIQELSLHNIQLKEAERKSIAREIHDEFGQLLTAMKMDVRMLAMRLPAEQAQAQDDLKQIERIIGETVAASRRVIANLRPPAVDLGLDAGVEWLVEDFRQRTDIDCSLTLPENPPEVPEEVAVHVFRILQESLNNVMKHADATRVAVNLRLAEDHLELEVSDNGRGFDSSQSTRQFGLLGIRERLYLLDGHLRLKTKPGMGVRLSITVPLSHTAPLSLTAPLSRLP